MEYTALWGPKGFIVSPSKIVPILDLSTTFALKSDKGNDTSGTATTNTRGREPQSVSLSTRYVRGAGVDPRGQLAEWHALVGVAHPLYVGGQRFGPPKLMLKSVDISNVLMTNTGKFLQADVTLSFEEYADSTAAVSSGNTSAQKAASTYNSIVEQKTAQKKQALTATAKPLDKQAKKPTTKAVMLK